MMIKRQKSPKVHGQPAAGTNSFRAVALNRQRSESKPDELDVVYQVANAVTPGQNKQLNTGPVTMVDKNATLHSRGCGH